MWADIAAELGGTAQARRMQWTRAIERVARELGLEGTNEESTQPPTRRPVHLPLTRLCPLVSSAART